MRRRRRWLPRRWWPPPPALLALLPAALLLALGLGSGGGAFAGAAPAQGRRAGSRVARRSLHGAAAALPTLYVYDHCPFCVRARMIFGLKGIRHSLVWMPNDDVQTPTSLVGKKIAPILEMPGEAPMPESLDIIKRIDEEPEWGPPLLQPATGREDLKEWNKRVSGIMRLLVRPRYPRGYFPEFAWRRSREAFVRNHPVADPETGVIPQKAEWLDMGKKAWDAWYDAHLSNTDSLLKELNAAVAELEDLVDSEESVSPGGVGYDDVAFWDRLRGATIIKGLHLGPKTKAYVEKMSEKTDIPLLISIAI